MKKLLLSLFFIAGIAVAGHAQIFSQNFSSSNTVSDYVNATSPGTSLFTAISNTTNSPSTISGGKLTFTKNSLTSAANSYISYGSSTPGNKFTSQVIQLKFEFSVSSQANASTTAVVFAIGSGTSFGASSTAPTPATGLNTRFAINFDATAGSFTVRNISTATTFPTVFSGPQVITLIINRQTNQQTIGYTPPGGASITETVAYGKWDLWVGTTKCFDDNDQDEVTNILDNFKIFTQSAIPASITTFDDFNVINGGPTLPVSLTSFTAKANLQNVDLAWSTAGEKNNSHFDILRSGDGKTFTKIDEVKGAGTTDATKNYTYIDRNALPGISYYQLKQVDNDGTPSLSDVAVVKSNVAASNFKVVASKQESAVKLSVFAASEGKATFKIYDLNGRKLADQELTLSKGYSNVSVPFNGTTGLHIATLTTANETVSQKFIK